MSHNKWIKIRIIYNLFLFQLLKNMSIKFSKYDEESYENAILRDGLPS